MPLLHFLSILELEILKLILETFQLFFLNPLSSCHKHFSIQSEYSQKRNIFFLTSAHTEKSSHALQR